MTDTETSTAAEAAPPSPWDLYNQQIQQAVSRNKVAVFDALAAAGIDTLEVSFDGCNDSGQIEGMLPRRAGEMVPLPDVRIAGHFADYNQDGLVESTAPLQQSIEELCYGFLEMEQGGWEIDEGAFGEFIFDVAARTITLDFNGRYTSHVTTTHEF